MSSNNLPTSSNSVNQPCPKNDNDNINLIIKKSVTLSDCNQDLPFIPKEFQAKIAQNPVNIDDMAKN